MARSSYNRPPAGRAVSSRGVALANGQRVRGRGWPAGAAVAGLRLLLLRGAAAGSE